MLDFSDGLEHVLCIVYVCTEYLSEMVFILRYKIGFVLVFVLAKTRVGSCSQQGYRVLSCITRFWITCVMLWAHSNWPAGRGRLNICRRQNCHQHWHCTNSNNPSSHCKLNLRPTDLYAVIRGHPVGQAGWNRWTGKALVGSTEGCWMISIRLFTFWCQAALQTSICQEGVGWYRYDY